MKKSAAAVFVLALIVASMLVPIAVQYIVVRPRRFANTKVLKPTLLYGREKRKQLAPNEDAGWEELGIDTRLAKAMRYRMDIESPNKLQVRSIPAILKGEDVVLYAYTGSGKTLAGLVPLVHQMLRDCTPIGSSDVKNTSKQLPVRPKMLVVTAFVELTRQILCVLEGLLSETPQLVSISEKDYREYLLLNGLHILLKKIRPDILVCTPEELMQLSSKGHIRLDQLRYAMIDEVDELPCFGNSGEAFFRIINPKIYHVQKVLASATALSNPGKASKLTALLFRRYMVFDANDGLEGSPGKGARTTLALPPTLANYYLSISCAKQKYKGWLYDMKFKALVYLLEKKGVEGRTFVFINPEQASIAKKNKTSIAKKKARPIAKKLVRNLLKYGYDAGELPSSGIRAASANQLRSSIDPHWRVVVAPGEIAARGLDPESVGLVVNFDLPLDAKNFVHRAGRAGRAGREGEVVSLVRSGKEVERLIGMIGKKLGAPERLKIAATDIEEVYENLRALAKFR